MKKVLLLVMAVSLLAFAAPALAQDLAPSLIIEDLEGCDVAFDVDVYKDKTIRILKDVDKYLDLKVDVKVDPAEWADVEVFKCDLNQNNSVDEKWVETKDEIAGSGSFNGFAGIAQVNQAAGVMNNQGNITAIAVTNNFGGGVLESSGGGEPGDDLIDPGSVALAEVAVQLENNDNNYTSSGSGSQHMDKIENSFSGFRGIANVNQASGHMNNQNNVVGIAANLDPAGVVAEADTFLAMANCGNQAASGIEDLRNKAEINSSFNGACGIANVNQSPGSMNNQANIVTISYAGYSGAGTQF